MRGAWTIYRRELAGLFLSPLAWVLALVSVLYNAFFFLGLLEGAGGEVNTALVLVLGGGWTFWILNVFLPPLITMRMISEESRSGLLEFLLTAPVADAAIVVGKAAAATTFLALVWGFAPIAGVVVAALGAPPDWGVLATAYLGAVFASAFFASLGILCSALSSTPLVAAFLACVLNVGLLSAGFVSRLGRMPLFEAVVERIDPLSKYHGSFRSGAIDSAHVLFFVAWVAAFLFLSVRLVERRRWL